MHAAGVGRQGAKPFASAARLVGRRRVEHSSNALRDEIAYGPPAPGGLDFQATIERLVEVDSGFMRAR